MGRRYGDEFEARANENEMLAVGGRDRERMERVAAGDAAGFWELVQQNHDDLKWCGSSPVYTFLRVMPDARGSIDKYEQWNIDPQSVVSFAGMSFRNGGTDFSL
jgi:predicted class III extradiol MEMO1 family dioxygenase